MICVKHNEEKILYGKQYKCKSCNREHQRRWFSENKEVQRERSKNTPSHLNRKPKIRQTPMYQTLCLFEGCDRFFKSKGYCEAHYLQLREDRPFTAISSRQSTKGICSIQDCGNKIYQIRLCKSHFSKQVRHNRRTADGKATAFQIYQRFQMFGSRCWICRDNKQLEIEHVKPISAGGSNWPSNIRPVCRSCNIKKGSKWFGVSKLYTIVNWILDE